MDVVKTSSLFPLFSIVFPWCLIHAPSWGNLLFRNMLKKWYHDTMRLVGLYSFPLHGSTRESNAAGKYPNDGFSIATVDGCELLHHLEWLKPYK